MKRLILPLLTALSIILAVTACKKGDGSIASNLPREFKTMSDKERVDYLVESSSPDSVARFIIDAALGDIPGAKIDTLMMAQGYAYEAYQSQPEQMSVFSSEFEHYSASLSLSKKRRLYAMSGMHDPEGYGYDLGLEYVSYIRDHKLSVADVTKEISDFKRNCGPDQATYRRFVKGFKIALEADHGKGIPEDIYQRFIVLEAPAPKPEVSSASTAPVQSAPAATAPAEAAEAASEPSAAPAEE